MSTLYPEWKMPAACPHIQVDRRVRLEMATRIAAGFATIESMRPTDIVACAFDLTDRLLQEANR